MPPDNLVEGEAVQFKLEPLDLHEKEFPTYMRDYFKKIDQRLVHSYYDVEQLLMKQENGYERHYVKLMHKGAMCGIALFNCDQTTPNEFRGYIRHVSTLDFSHIGTAVEQVMEFIWKYMYCTNVRVEIYHMKDEASGKVQADPDVKNAYAKQGFKWKTLSNDPHTGKRA